MGVRPPVGVTIAMLGPCSLLGAEAMCEPSGDHTGCMICPIEPRDGVSEIELRHRLGGADQVVDGVPQRFLAVHEDVALLIPCEPWGCWLSWPVIFSRP
jgi:hypothetical protein